MTNDTVTAVKDLTTKLRYTVSDIGSALALAEQLRLVRVGIAVSEQFLSAKENRPFSDDLAPVAHKIKADVAIPMAAPGSTARAYCPQEVAVLFALFHVAACQLDIVDCFLLLSRRSEAALNERVRTMIKQIEKLPRSD